MVDLVLPSRVRIGRNGSQETPKFILPPMTRQVRIALDRRTISPGTRVTPIIRVRGDTVDLAARGRLTGGLRVSDIDGSPINEYSLGYTLPWGLFGESGNTRRFGEDKSSLEAWVELLVDGDPLDTVMSVSYDEAPAPARKFKNSVVVDVAADLPESGGDGDISYDHTSSGRNRGAFATTVWSSTGLDITTMTWNGAMTEHWDLTGGSNVRGAGHTKAGQSSGAQNVNAILGGSPSIFILSTISLYNVDQGTPVGTAVTSTSAFSVDVATPNSNSQIVDSLSTGHGSSLTHTEGANQTVGETEEVSGFIRLSTSTQSGEDGSTMSWSNSPGQDYGQILGAIEFLEASEGAIRRRVDHGY